MNTALIVIAKAPRAGHSKTRLSPPCTPEEAAGLARAALLDTLEAVAATPCSRRVLVLDGDPAEWRRPGFDLLPQSTGGLEDRIATAFEAVGCPAVLIGMDTPQVTPAVLSDAIAELEADGRDAVLGTCPDGGWWTIGLREANRAIFSGLPMSVPWTAKAQRIRLTELGLEFTEMPSLRDVDTIEDARAVASDAPGTRFAAALSELTEKAA